MTQILSILILSAGLTDGFSTIDARSRGVSVLPTRRTRPHCLQISVTGFQDATISAEDGNDKDALLRNLNSAGETGIEQSIDVPLGEEEKKIEAPSVKSIMRIAIPAIGIWLCSPLLSTIDTSTVGLLAGTAQQAALSPAVAVTDYSARLMVRKVIQLCDDFAPFYSFA